MSPSADLREFIALLNSHSVEYVIIGAHSLAYHGRPRYTGHIDILVRPLPENAAKLPIVMDKFGFTGTGFKESDFVEPDQIIQLGRIPNRIDLLTAATELEGLPVFMLSKALLIQNKRALARPQDLADLDTLS